MTALAEDAKDKKGEQARAAGQMQGTARRNENVPVYQIDTNAQKDLDKRVGIQLRVPAELPVERTFFASEFGQASRGEVVIPKIPAAAGWHGELFEVHESSVFNARSFFQVGPVQPSHENSYGLNLGGPAGKLGDLFGAFAQQKVRGMVNGNVLVPLDGERTPRASDPELRAVIQRFLNAYPDQLPNRPDFDPRALNTNAPQRVDATQGILRLIQDLTSSQAHLQDAVERLETPGRPRSARRRFGLTSPSENGVWPGNGQLPWPGGQLPPIGGPPSGRPAGTLLYDAVFLAADEVLRNEAGRKTIILISDGVDQGSKISQKEAIETALRADCIIYSIRYYDDEAYRRGRPGIVLGGPGSEGYSALKAISSQTDGSVYEVSSKLTLAEIFDKIQEELRSQYSLSYNAPPGGSRDGFRKIKLQTEDKKLKVVTRSGYYRDAAALEHR